MSKDSSLDPKMTNTFATNNDNFDNSFNIINNNVLKMQDNGDENDEETYYTYTYQLVFSGFLPMVMKSIIKMGVLKVIHDHANPEGLSPAEIAGQLNMSNPNAPVMLDRMHRLLATYAVVRCITVTTFDGAVARRYRPSPATKYLVPNDDGVSLAGMLDLNTDKVFLESWSMLDKAVSEGGIPFNMVHGMHAFEYPRVDPRFNEVFNKAMYETTTFTIKKILEKYNGFENIQQLVDVGGGLGHTLRVITSKYPTIKAINFDLPHVIENALPCSGIKHVQGDMFESVPEGDAIFMKWILHDWSDEHCLKLLENCYKSLPEHGKVIVVEAIMEDEALNTLSGRASSQLDVAMMTQIPGGKERSKQEFKALAKATGFSHVNFECCVYNFWIMEFYK